MAALVLLAFGGAGAPTARAVTYAYLAITLSGNGSGVYHSDDGQIDCHIFDGVADPRGCDGQYELGSNGSVTVGYTITPEYGSCIQYFDTCDARSNSGTITFSSNATDEAIFNLLPTYLVSVGKSGAGSGTITSTPSGISCGATCSANFPKGTTVTLNASPASGSAFTSWSGACAGQGASCSLLITSARSTTALFAKLPTPPPTATPTAKPSPSSGTKPTPTPAASKPGATTLPSTATSTSQPQASGQGGATTEPGASQDALATDLPGASVPPTAGALETATPSVPVASPAAIPAADSG
ncbi:MAG TPA: hypothetical protein VHL56_07635, partial [Candidatus Limnocylindrales bacterium]|nr:hypothetical protein [Candidatus Limnocylindrales bacterium]